MLENFKNLTSAEIEESVLKFWQENKTFEKSLSKSYKALPVGRQAKAKSYVFFDGPPFATGLPHYGHILASIIKDVIPRYQTMKGKIVPRRWGWDCHGLPVENEIEKKLGLKTKKDIENIGIEKFNETAKSAVLEYAGEWKKIIPRIGRWVDMENDYKTMDWTYTESVWWIFKKLFDKKLIYEGYKPMHLCPRCETTLANFEVSQGYKDITDISVIAKFELIDEPNTFVLAWTTTPWTLPGNAALAINQNLIYCKIKNQKSKIKNTGQNLKLKEGEFYILAKKRLDKILDGEDYEIISEFKGSELIGKKYKPLFDYYSKDKNLKNHDNGWEIYSGDFVTTEEGTGVVHIAPAFGEDDMKMAQKYNLPFIQHVSTDGKFKAEVSDFAGMPVKQKEDHQKTDIEIIKWLAANNKLFGKQKIIHSYPHCWRCDTPLLNYAASSWFVKVTAIKNKLIANNKKINWIPAHIKNGRFGKWLEDARDWAISRSRFWGAPLPIWKCEKCDNQRAIGSIEELKKYSRKSGNKYFVIRHGEANHNEKNVSSAKLETSNQHPLIKKGEKEIEKAAKKIKKLGIDLIFSSDFLRTKQTAEIIIETIGYSKNKIIYDQRLREVNTGIFDNKSAEEYHSNFSSLEEKFYKNPPDGENLTELKNRVTEFLYDIENKYSGKNILIISHEYPIWLMFVGSFGADAKKSAIMKQEKGDDFIKTAELLELDFTPIPHNKNYELDLHKPYIDEIDLICDCGGKMKRINDVFDCWFESGAMPYASAHFPFAFNIGTSDVPNIKRHNFRTSDVQKFPFPAEFIAEGIDQTRGWFYTLLVLSTALFNKPAYKNVIVNGIILAEDGQKMSKRLKNYPDPVEIINKYGADALRLYLLSSHVVRAEDLNFSEKGVDEVYKKVILRLWNVYKFYELYSERKIKAKVKAEIKSENVLDIWILARLNQLGAEVSKALDNYELDRASRPIADFVDDLSTWYLRRSRTRFKVPYAPHLHKADKKAGKDVDSAIKTTKFVLVELSKVIAPFMPFISETIYNLVNEGKESVHLREWPKIKALPKKEKDIIEKMKVVRNIVEKALTLRAALGIKVRQPLKELRIKNLGLRIKEEMLDLVKDEINVKEIIFDSNIKNEFELDVVITPELKIEGHLRELVRIIQDLRKEAGYTPKIKTALYIHSDDYFKTLINNHIDYLKKEVGAKTIELRRADKFDAEEETKIDDSKIWIGIKKI